MGGISYVVGIAIASAGLEERLVMVRKKRGPSSVVGKLNGPGGKIEEGESPEDAVYREFEEECGVSVPPSQWETRIALSDHGGRWLVVFLVAHLRDSQISRVVTATDEVVEWQRVGDLPRLPVVENLRWLVPLALDSNIRGPLFLTDDSEPLPEPEESPLPEIGPVAPPEPEPIEWEDVTFRSPTAGSPPLDPSSEPPPRSGSYLRETINEEPDLARGRPGTAEPLVGDLRVETPSGEPVAAREENDEE